MDSHAKNTRSGTTLERDKGEVDFKEDKKEHPMQMGLSYRLTDTE